MIGTDYPFAFHEKDPIARLRETFADERICNRLTCENARRFLKMGEARA
jgi:aminocarboxymuconate-semialdehyde decarboxylase